MDENLPTTRQQTHPADGSIEIPMPVAARTLLLLSASAATANAGWAHGWRDQYIRVSQRLGQKVSAEMRHMRKLGLLGENEGAPEHLKQKARDAVRHAERVHHAQRHNARELAKPEHQRRKLMDVECKGRTCTVNGMTHADMSLFDCPWVNSLHPYLNTTITADSLLATGSLPGVEPAVARMTESPHPYLRANPNPFVDGGLCLPFQEIPFPYPTKTYGGVDAAAANIKCPGPDWDPDAGTCSSGPGTCQYAPMLKPSWLGTRPACRLSAGFSQRQITPRAARSVGQPRPIRHLGRAGLAGHTLGLVSS